MLQAFRRGVAAFTLAAALLPLSTATGRADFGFWGYCGCKCKPSCDVFYSGFYGYYPTCWRPWPGGQPDCPAYIMAPVPQMSEKETAPPPTLPRPMQLPSPQPQ